MDYVSTDCVSMIIRILGSAVDYWLLLLNFIVLLNNAHCCFESLQIAQKSPTVKSIQRPNHTHFQFQQSD